MNEQFDLLISGGGIVGLALAACLQETALRVAVLEQAPAELVWDPSGFALRVSAINRASEMIFRNTGVWEFIEAERLSPYRKIRVTDTQGHGSLCFDRSEIAELNLGYIIENRVIHKSLLSRLSQWENFHYFAPAKIQGFWHEDTAIAAQLDDGRIFKAALMIGADGANSWIRDQAGFHLRQKPYGHHAVVCTVTTELPHQETARQWFLPDGVLAFLPLSDACTSSIVWSTMPERAKFLSEAAADVFDAELTAASQGELGKVQNSSARVTFPLRMRHADAYVKPRIALVGDAAHTVHPLAGQGMNLGILDAASLAEVLVTAHQQRRDIGHLHTLRKYERWRKGENTAMLYAMDAFKFLFADHAPTLNWIRGFGLNLTNRSALVKSCFAKKALGIWGDLPRLAVTLASLR